MGRAQLPSTDPDTVWLLSLIEAMDEIAASSQACEPSDIKAFSNRLDLPLMPSKAFVRRIPCRCPALFVFGDEHR